MKRSVKALRLKYGCKSGFTGEKEDSAGRTQCYVEGDHVACNQPENPQVESRGKGEDTVEAVRQDYKQNGVKSKAFKNWFGDWENNSEQASKVVNKETGEPQETHPIPGTGSQARGKNGNPIVVYHGTWKGDFDEFRKDKISDRNLFGPGFYFTEDRDVAESYRKKDEPSENDKESDESKVYAVYLNIRKPFDIDNPPAFRDFPDVAKSLLLEVFPYMEHRQDELVKYARLLSVWKDKSKVNEFLAQHGYDGFTHIGGDRSGEGQHHRVWIAFEPNQIKSVDNVGTFDPNTGRIGKGLRSDGRVHR